MKIGGCGTSLGTGGMQTKIVAAELATTIGCATVIVLGKYPERVLRLLEMTSSAHELAEILEKTLEAESSLPLFDFRFTLFPGRQDETMKDRKMWILYGLHSYGTVYIDDGAVKALREVLGSYKFISLTSK